MNETPWFVELKSSLPEEQWARILLALSQDPIFLNASLRKSNAKALSHNSDNSLTNWSPAYLAIRVIDNSANIKLSSMNETSSEASADLQFVPLSKTLETRIARTLQAIKFEDGRIFGFDLEKAGQIALKLREDFQSQKSWQEIEDKLNSYGVHFQSILACLLGLIPDQLGFLSHLISNNQDDKRLNQIIRAFLSIPAKIDEQIEFLTNVIERIPPRFKLSLVKTIAEQRPGMGSLLAERVNAQTEPGRLQSTHKNLKELNASLVGLEFHQYTKKTEIPLNEITYAIDLNRNIQGELEYLLGHLYGRNLTSKSKKNDQNKSLEALRASVRTDPRNPKYLSSLVSVLLNIGRIEEAQAWLDAFRGDQLHPMVEYQRARLFDMQSIPDEAKKAAKRALENLSLLQNQDFLDLALSLASFFRSHHEFEHVLPVIQSIIINHPTHSGFLAYLAEYYLLTGNYKEALIKASIAYASELTGDIYNELSDSLPNLHTLYVQTLEAAGEWMSVYNERKKIISLQDNETPEELSALAKAALHVNKLEESLDAAKKAIQLDPENGEGYEVSGKAYFISGNLQRAIECFQKATQFNPGLVTNWISLSKAYENNQQYEQAYECLKTATHALPDNFEGHLALADYYLSHNAPTQAIDPLEIASKQIQAINGNIYQLKQSAVSLESLPQIKSQIALKLGTALKSVGRITDSERVLKQGLEASEGGAAHNPELCYAYALSLLGSRKYHEAIPLLECVIESKPDFIPAFLDLAQTLLVVENQPEGAEQVIPLASHVLENTREPESIARAQALMAEAYNWTGDPKKAQEYYQTVLNSSIAKSLSWHGRITTGMGKVNYALNQPEAAVAAFQEALRINPGDPELHRWLARAYLAADLIQESFDTAKQLTHLLPNHLETTIWYAEHCQKINDTSGGNQIPALQDAVRILLRYIQKDPSAPQVWLKLGQIHLSDGELKAAYAAFDQLADIPTQTPAHSLEKAGLLEQAGDALAGENCWDLSISMYEQAYLTSLEGKKDSKLSPVQQQVIEPSTILGKLANAQIQAGDTDSAIDVFRKITLLDPVNTDGFIRLSELLIDKAMFKEALGCLEKALETKPHHDNLINKLVWLLLEIGDFHAAMEKLTQALGNNDIVLDKETEYSYRYQAAEISCGLLLFDKARDLLIDVHDNQIDQNLLANYYLLQCELDYRKGIAPPASYLEKIETLIDHDHPRLVATKLVLNPFNKKSPEYNLFRASIEDLPEKLENEVQAGNSLTRLLSIGILRACFQASISIRQWDLGCKLSQSLTEKNSMEPLAHIQQAQFLTIRAEEQRLCEYLDITNGAPGIESLNNQAFHQFLTAVEKTLRRYSDINLETNNHKDPNQDTYKDSLIHYWRQRGLAVFQPNYQNIRSYELLYQNGEDARPLLLAYRNQNDVSFISRIGKIHEGKPQLLLLLALALEKVKPWESLEVICQAIDTSTTKEMSDGDLIASCHFLLSRVTQRTGGKNRLGISPLQAIETAIQLSPSQPRWHSFASEIILLGQELTDPDDITRQAREHIETAIQLEPDYAKHHFSLGMLYLKNGDKDKAYTCFETACSLKPNLAESWLELARIQFQNGDIQVATISTDQSLRISPDYVDALLLRGDIALLSGNPRGALSKAQAILRQEPDHPLAMQLQARALNALNRSEEALKIMAKVIPNVDKPLQLELERSQWLSKGANTQEAVDELRSLSEKYPQEPLFKAYLAETLMRRKHKDAAVIAARQALSDANLGLSLEQQSNLHLMIGRFYRENGQLDNAIQHLSDAIEINPTNLEAHIELGFTHQDRRQYSLAFKAFQGAIHIAPEDSRPYFLAGISLKEAKEYHTAEEMLRKAIELSPGDTTIQRQLGAVVALNLVHNRRSTIYHQQAP